MSLGTAGLVFSAGAGQTIVPVTPAEASADAAALGSLIGSNGAGVTGGGGGNASASGGPVVFTGGARGWGRRGGRMGEVVILMGLHILLMGLGLG